jgi:hypothetical protein
MTIDANLTPDSWTSFAGAMELNELRDDVRAILAATKAPGVFSYELPGPEDGEDPANYEPYGDGEYWDIVYRDGALEDRRQLEYDDEIDWGYDNLPQAAIDTLAEVLRFLEQKDQIEAI